MSKPDDFKKLQDKWYKKLKDSGFEDIEQDEQRLKRWDSMYFITRHTSFVGNSAKQVAGSHRKLSTDQFKSQQEYYQLAGVFLHNHQFKDSKERTIWELHSEGYPTSDIYKVMKAKKQAVYLEGIHKTIKALAKIMVDQCHPKKT